MASSSSLSSLSIALVGLEPGGGDTIGSSAGSRGCCLGTGDLVRRTS